MPAEQLARLLNRPRPLSSGSIWHAEGEIDRLVRESIAGTRRPVTEPHHGREPGDGAREWSVRYQIPTISAKAPLVALATLGDAHSPTLTDILTDAPPDAEKPLPLEMMHAGAAGVVGTWWTVTPAEDRVFWRTFYRALSNDATLGTAVAQARAAVRAFNPVQPYWMAYYAIGNPMARGYPLVEAEGYFELVPLDHKDRAAPLKAGQRYKFEVLLRRHAPAQYQGRRHRLRPLPQPSSQLCITTTMCEPITDMVLISPPTDADLMRWTFTLFPTQAGTDLLQLALMGANTDQPPIVMSDRYPLKIGEGTFPGIQGVMSRDPVNRPCLQIVVDHESYRIADRTERFQGVNKHAVERLDVNLREHFSHLMQHQEVSLSKMKDASLLFAKSLKEWRSHPWWADLAPDSHLSLTNRLINVPFELLPNADQFLGVHCSIGYGSAARALSPKRVTNIAVMMNEDTPSPQGVFDCLTALVGKDRVKDGGGYTARPKDPFMMLQDMMYGTRADIVHLPLQSVALPDGRGLSLTCKTKTIHFQQNAFRNATIQFYDEPLIFLNATQPDHVYDVVPMADYAYHLLERGAGAVIAPSFAIPNRFADQVAMTFYTELFESSGLTLGQILMRTRRRLLELGNPFGLVYMLFGSPEARYARRIS